MTNSKLEDIEWQNWFAKDQAEGEANLAEQEQKQEALGIKVPKNN